MARGREAAVCSHADQLRREVNGDRVSYVVNRNVNYTNVCYFHCRFCAFSKASLPTICAACPTRWISRRSRAAPARPGSGARPRCACRAASTPTTGATYLDICRTVKRRRPRSTCTRSRRSRCGRARAPCVTSAIPRRAARAGLGLARHRRRDPGRRGARVICPDKIKTAEWLEVMRCAHGLGPAQHGDRDVRPRRPAAPLGQAPAAHPRPAGGDGRLHRVRAAAVRAHGGADLPEGGARKGRPGAKPC